MTAVVSGVLDRTTSRRWLAVVSLSLTGLAVLTRVPGVLSARMFNVDESYLAAMGSTMGRGGHLYVDAVDRKPPLLPWLYSLPQSVFGSEDLRPLRLAVALAIAATGVTVALLVLRLGGDRRGGFAAGALLVFGSAAFLPADGQAANFEVFALLPASAAVLLVVSARHRHGWHRIGRWVAAGSLVAVAGMIKQPFFAMLAPLGWEAWRSTRRWSDGLAAGAGVAITILLVAFPFGMGAVWRWAWADTGDYLGGRLDAARIIEMLAVIIVMFVVLHLPTLTSIWARRSRLRGIDPVIWFWLAGAAIAVVPGFRFIAHYFQLFVPPLAALAGVLLSSARSPRSTPESTRHDGRDVRRVLLASCVVAVVCTMAASSKLADASQVRPELVAAIDARSAPHDRILVWGALPEAYWRSGRLPGQRFLSVGYVTGKWADRSHPPSNVETVEPFRSRWAIFDRDLRAHPPMVVIDTSTSGLDGWDRYSPSRYQFGQVLDGCYRQDGQVDRMTIWTLTDASCVRRLAQ
ncbi:MAG: ArnT family glycosyltransferase [Acidimicrobiales bacterium]